MLYHSIINGFSLARDINQWKSIYVKLFKEPVKLTFTSHSYRPIKHLTEDFIMSEESGMGQPASSKNDTDQKTFDEIICLRPLFW
jgi:hypothetical protein